MNAIKRALLMRFLPQRTAIGLALLLLSVTGAAGAVLGSEACSSGAASAICGGAQKVIDALGPWLAIMGVADRERK